MLLLVSSLTTLLAFFNTCYPVSVGFLIASLSVLLLNYVEYTPVWLIHGLLMSLCVLSTCKL